MVWQLPWSRVPRSYAATIRLITGHVLDRLAELADQSVHCVVTSPPYYGLRDYGIEPQVWGGEAGCPHEWGDEATAYRPAYSEGFVPRGDLSAAQSYKHQGGTVSQGAFCRRCPGWRGSLGLEPTPALYIEHMVAVFREVRRVLRADGTCWVNIGDSYNSGAQGWRPGNPAKNHGNSNRDGVNAPGLKPKDLLGMPWMLAFALRDDGWYLRSEITWAKRAPMPESVTDRPTTATEKVFLLSKSARYFYDAEAVKEEAEYGRREAVGNMWNNQRRADPRDAREGGSHDVRGKNPETGRNMRNWWLLGPEPFPEAHFATFPSEIPRRAILAGTSEKGVCPKCGAPWERVAVKTCDSNRPGGYNIKLYAGRGDANVLAERGRVGDSTSETIDWKPGCGCAFSGLDCDVVKLNPAVVLDPFLGAGTTALVADQLQRDGIGIELNPEYAEMAKRRLRQDNSLFLQMAAD